MTRRPAAGLAAAVCLALAACQDFEYWEGEYPVADLTPPGDSRLAEDGEAEEPPAEAAAETALPAEAPAETVAETVFPEAASEEEPPPPLLDLLPDPAIVEQLQVPPPEPAIVAQPQVPPPTPPAPPSAAPPAVAAPPAPPAPPPVAARPPPVPEFLRPSEPPPPPEPPPERPVAAIPELPAIPRPAPAGEPVFSRTVTAYTGQLVEVPFRGPGWLYLGELGARRGVSYDSRRVDAEGMTFVFRADEAGTYSLRFNQQDFIRDVVTSDYVKVIVEAAPEVSGPAWNSAAVMPDRVYAGPRFPPAVPQSAGGAVKPEPAAQTAARPDDAARAAAEQPSAQTPPAPPEKAPSPAAYLGKAKEEYGAGRIDGALEALDGLRAAYPEGSDEAYWLYAQALEANGPSRDVKRALDYYRRLVREYPQSDHYEAAARRIAYLERFYFDIR